MGSILGAICAKCGAKFQYSRGGGFVFHLLRCDACGMEKEISFEDLGVVHKSYIKGLRGPYSSVSADHDEKIQKNFPGEPMSEEEYRKEVERIAGVCGCGGGFKFNVSPRCPKCKSDSFYEDREFGVILYD